MNQPVQNSSASRAGHRGHSEPRKKPRIDIGVGLPLALDSGAFSIFNKFIVPNRGKGRGDRQKSNTIRDQMKLTYHKSREFRAYLADYIKYLHAQALPYTFYVTLDIIFQPEATWEVYQEMRKNGLRPLPVYHFGEVISYLKRYMKDTNYVGLGGLGHESNRERYKSFADPAWKVLCDGDYKRKPPTHKVHGFAIGGYELISRYPWTSVYATTPLYFGRMGGILIPKFYRSGPDYSGVPSQLSVTQRTGTNKKHVGHHREGGAKEKALAQYLELLGLTKEEVMTDYVARDIANTYFTNGMMRAVQRVHSERFGQEYKTLFYVSGTPNHSDPASILLIVTEWLRNLRFDEHLGYLGTYYKVRGARQVLEAVLGAWHNVRPKWEEVQK